MSRLILALDSAGAPNRWIDVETAAHYYAKQLVAWSLGEHEWVLHGGVSQRTGLRSVLRLSSIIAVAGKDFMVRHYDRVPSITKTMLFARDRHVCAYCGARFATADLEMEHVVPHCQGGPFSWTNLVSACRVCNDRKADKTPEQARMPLLYVPYVPNRHEAFILSNRKILADQMEFLLRGVPRHSRLHG
jgi:hypothetical protein